MTQPTDERATVLTGDARNLPIPTESVHCIVTSPPYLGVQDFNVPATPWSSNSNQCDHRWQNHKFPNNPNPQPYCTKPDCDAWLGCYGAEPSIEEYLIHTVQIFQELWRVLRSDGTLWLNIGDAYNTRKIPFNSLNPNHQGAAQIGQVRSRPKKKDLMLMPARIALALQQDGWRIRAENIWSKNSSRPEAPIDRTRRTHEQVYLLTKTDKYFYDTEAVKTPASPNTRPRRKDGRYQPAKGSNPADRRIGSWTYSYAPDSVHLTSVWQIASHKNEEQHHATFPEALADLCILASTSDKGVCPQCGKPWTRQDTPSRPQTTQSLFTASANQPEPTGNNGWAPTCQHQSSPIPALVLDPFSGAGATVASALRLGRRAIGVDANPAYVQAAKDRISKLSLTLF